eukprot:CAMPEP_0197440828 /NCGR_PEP_ID=MMETSP1175-20131217/7232_1 /TAXON_ID=1003142 /ORGANISM="Triceratium dubium, Strain CCMP147" /LENGTH=471 /DNA_ID=CAMNT_0042971003 /DNA_START=279 /DNA_END=1694 /DNA_ORIENTATION=-
MSRDGDNEDNSSSDSDEKRRMSDVRAVQNMFYSSSSTDVGADPSSVATKSPRLDYKTGMYLNLPLWREKLGYTELPGRSLLGFIRDPSYTHMFETILRRNDGKMYFGQLRLDNDDVGINVNAVGAGIGADPLPQAKETDMSAPLFSWEARINNSDAVVVGTLMRINDHIRLDDGRLMLLVHALERFVIVEPKQILPYPIADVLLLPDKEEAFASPGDEDLGLAVTESLLRWSTYEYDESVRFPIGMQEDENEDRIMSLNDVLSAGGGDVLGTLMPFVPYSSGVDDAEAVSDANNRKESMVEGRSGVTFSDLEKQGIVREVDSLLLQRVSNPDGIPDARDIERDLWILIDEYVQLREITNVFPKHLLSLLPRDVIWPETFTLDKLANAYSGIGSAGNEGTFTRVADHVDYPAQRRQKRLSYACTALLGGPVNDHPLLNRKMRRKLLEIPSTQGRLWAARELFEAYLSQFQRE